MSSTIKQKIENWKINRRFPVRWLSYKARIRRDIDEAFSLPDGKEIFDHEYVDRTVQAIKQLEDWQVKLMSVSFAVYTFLVIGFITNDASVSLFGVSLKQAAGVKEVLLAFTATLGVLMIIITQSKETLIAVIEKLTELSTGESSLPLAALGARSSFHLKVYVPRQYDQWIFPTLLTKLLSLLLWLLWIAIALFLIGASIGLTVFLAVQIYIRPTLGIWSTLILYYVGAAFMLSLFAAIRFHLPFPYRDKSELKRMSELEKTDRRAYLALRKKYYGH